MLSNFRCMEEASEMARIVRRSRVPVPAMQEVKETPETRLHSVQESAA